MIVAGIGCRNECAAEEIIALVQQAMAESGARVMLLATAAHRAALPPVQLAAKRLGLLLVAVAQADLAAEQTRCVTRSAVAQAATGLASIAEAAALAAAGPGSRLLLPRIASAAATCAIAGAS